MGAPLASSVLRVSHGARISPARSSLAEIRDYSQSRAEMQFYLLSEVDFHRLVGPVSIRGSIASFS